MLGSPTVSDLSQRTKAQGKKFGLLFFMLTLACAGIFRVLTNVFSSRKLLVVSGLNKLDTRSFGGAVTNENKET